MLTENTYQSEQRNMSTVRVKMSENAGAGVSHPACPGRHRVRYQKPPVHTEGNRLTSHHQPVFDFTAHNPGTLQAFGTQCSIL